MNTLNLRFWYNCKSRALQKALFILQHVLYTNYIIQKKILKQIFIFIIH